MKLQEPRHELVLPPDLGVPLGLLDVERYSVPMGSRAPLHPADLVLLGVCARGLLGKGPASAPLVLSTPRVHAVFEWVLYFRYVACRPPELVSSKSAHKCCHRT